MGKTLKIYVMGDSPSSLRTVELANWTGLSFLGERNHLSSVRSRVELSEPGIYLLLSDSSDSELTDIYIGETDDFIKRISDHSQSKDWWDRFIVFVSKDKNLTKAHVKYLERELYKLAKVSIGSLKVRNSQEPGGASLPESDVSSMQEFLANMLFVLETLGLSYFTSDKQPAIGEAKSIVASANSSSEVRYYMTLPKDASKSGESLRSYMQISNGVYVVKAGSYIRKTPRDSFVADQHTYHGQWKQITESDAVEQSEHPEALRTTRDIEFRSPSAAGSVLRARATNGRIEWKREGDDKPLVECQTEGLKVA